MFKTGSRNKQKTSVYTISSKSININRRFSSLNCLYVINKKKMEYKLADDKYKKK